jgi:hypothetical protein
MVVGLSFLLPLSSSCMPFFITFFVGAVFLGYMEPKWQAYNPTQRGGTVYTSQLVKEEKHLHW